MFFWTCCEAELDDHVECDVESETVLSLVPSAYENSMVEPMARSVPEASGASKAARLEAQTTTLLEAGFSMSAKDARFAYSNRSCSSITVISAGPTEGVARRPHALVSSEPDCQELTEAVVASSDHEYPFEDNSADPESESACMSDQRPGVGEQESERDSDQMQPRLVNSMQFDPYSFEVSVQPARLGRERERRMGPVSSEGSNSSSKVSVTFASEASVEHSYSNRNRMNGITYDGDKSSGKIVGSSITFEATPGLRTSRDARRDSRTWRTHVEKSRAHSTPAPRTTQPDAVEA